MRLDDACPYHDRQRWQRMENILTACGVKPLVGLIPNCQDPALTQYPEDADFWPRARDWQSRGWTMALHGCDHVYVTDQGGLNPVNPRSEFAGLPLEAQKEKISQGVKLLQAQGIEPKVFFAPSHTFDENTLTALEQCSSIRIISDTVANAPYSKYGFTFVPQQSGRVRALPFEWVTFCYHPNEMDDKAFDELESFLKLHEGEFVSFPLTQSERKESLQDKLLRAAYFGKRKMKK
jgi:hypothetical protein